jgi:hypothetical protein
LSSSSEKPSSEGVGEGEKARGRWLNAGTLLLAPAAGWSNDGPGARLELADAALLLLLLLDEVELELASLSLSESTSMGAAAAGAGAGSGSLSDESDEDEDELEASRAAAVRALRARLRFGLPAAPGAMLAECGVVVRSGRRRCRERRATRARPSKIWAWRAGSVGRADTARLPAPPAAREGLSSARTSCPRSHLTALRTTTPCAHPPPTRSTTSCTARAPATSTSCAAHSPPLPPRARRR